MEIRDTSEYLNLYLVWGHQVYDYIVKTRIVKYQAYGLPGKNHCGNHPHNFYIQLFAETGILGLTFGICMIVFLFTTCYAGRRLYPNCPLASICYIIPLALFFPFQQTGSFFGQWGNLFIWFPIGFCVAQIQDYNSIFKKRFSR